MGQHADDFLDRVVQDCDGLTDYLAGHMSQEEALERGLLDEDGSLPEESQDLWGVYDVPSLINELEKCELALNQKPRIRLRLRKVLAWVDSSGKAWLPKEMTTVHLRNSIKYAERIGKGDSPIVMQMRTELKNRSVNEFDDQG